MKTRRIFAAVLTLALVFALAAVPAHAADADAVAAADALHDYGLFNGVGTNPDGTVNYDLDRTMSRHEAVTMLVRLLGKEEEAKAGTWQTPFTDVDEWAKPYVGYAYTHGLTYGVSADKFGGALDTTTAQYLTFVLRALGYSSSEDFQWDKSWELTDELGVTDGEYGPGTQFFRSDAAIISRNAIFVAPKGGSSPLINTLGKKPDRPAYLVMKINGEYCTNTVINYLIQYDTDHYDYASGYFNNGENIYVYKDLVFLSVLAAFPNYHHLCYFIRCANTDDYELAESKNPYIKKLSIPSGEPNGFDQYGEDETIWASPTEAYTPRWVEYNGVKVYMDITRQDGYYILDGIRYYNGMICVNDILARFGTKKQISVGCDKNYIDGDLYYIEFK